MLLEDILRRVGGWIGLFASATGLVLLLAWTSSQYASSGAASADVIPAGYAMCIMLAGLSVFADAYAGYRRVGFGFAAAAFSISVILAVEALFGVHSQAAASTPVAEVSDHTAGLLLVVAAGVLALSQKSGRRVFPTSAWLANIAVAGSTAGLISAAIHFGSKTAAPIHVSAGIAGAALLLAVATLLARSDDRHIQILFSQHATGAVARRLFLALAVLPFIFGAAFVILVRVRALELESAVLLFLGATIFSGFVMAFFSTETTAGVNDGREEAEQARLLLTARLQEQAAQLQETVNQRTRELREANASLRASAESNALLALVAQNTTNGVIITDGDGRIEWINSAFTRITGFELAEVKGHKQESILQGPETDRTTLEQLASAEAQGLGCQIEILNYTKQGRPVWHSLDLQPVHERSGRVVNWVANLADITTEREDKLRLEHLSERLKLATRAAELGVWEWDPVTRRMIWDARMLEIYGLAPSRFAGTQDEYLQRLHPEDRGRACGAIDAIVTGENGSQLEYRIIRADDQRTCQIRSSAIAERDDQGRLLRIIGTDRDITAERETTRQLQTSNERLQLALRSSSYGVWEYDLATGLRHFDERVLEMYGLTSAEFDGTEGAWRKTFHHEDYDAINAQVRQVIESNAADYDLHYRIVRPDGMIRHVEAHGHVQRDANGRAVRLVGLSRDVTERKQLEQALELAEQRWQLAIEGTNDSVWDWDVTTGHVYHDERWTRILGYSPEELDNSIDGWKALAHPDDLLENERAIQEHFAQRASFYCHELRMRAKDGTWRWILDRGKVVQRAPDGRPVRMVGTHSDVTERRELEERLRKIEQLADEVSRIAQIGGWEIDLVTSRVTWNEGTRRIHEVDSTFQPTLESMWQFFPPEALGVVQSALRDATPSQPSFDVEVPLVTATNRKIWVRILGHGEFKSGRAVSVRGAIQDITARHESEEARRGLETQLFQAQKMETLGTLAGGIAHDFNNLLTGIIGYHELAADSLPTDHPARECLAEARNASLRARELVEQILTFGRQSSSTEHVPVDLISVIEEARRFLRATLPANVSIEVETAPHCGQVLGDTTQLHQVILNLGSNAAHAMRQHGGILKISVEPAEVSPDLALTLGGPPASSYVRMSVSDTGHGMDEATRRRIFDPFFTTKNTREGTGLGLAVVHGIVRSHRGAIDVESTPGRGSTFHIYLPTVAAENSTPTEDASAAPRGGGEYVCVVDDEEVVGSCTKLVLESQGYRTLIFSSAEQCLSQVQSNPALCSVLVTDQTMPGMQGTELAAAMRRLRPEIPVVIMSGYFSKISPQALDELGQVELLAKPFTTDELAHAVHRALHPEPSVL